MPKFEYHVVPAPKKASKVKGVKGTDNRFAAELARLMNELGSEGWEYQRTDTLPVEERVGLTGRTTTYQNMLVFRRELQVPVEEPLEAPVAQDPEPVVQFRREPVEETSPPKEVAAPQTPEVAAGSPPTPAPARVTITGAEAPQLSATAEAPEGNAPAIQFRPRDRSIAAQ